MAEDREIEELGKESASPYVINQMFGLRQKLEPTEKEWEKKKGKPLYHIKMMNLKLMHASDATIRC